jgi:cell division septation protein DedD
VNNPAAAKTADKPVSAPVAIDKMAEAKLAADKLAADKALSEKLASEKAAAEKAKQEKLALEKQAQEKQAQEAKAAAEKAKQVAVKVESKPAAAVDLPNAWVVQVASLSAKDKADSLAQRLRQKSYRATVQQQGSMWKVFVGPELRKEVADTIKVKLANDPDLKLSGSWVQAYKP